MSEKKKIPASNKKPIKRKPKDLPKRALSACNFFFKEQRQKIVMAVNCEDERNRKKIDPDLTEDLIKKLRKDNGSVSFEETGKLIGSRWRVVKAMPDQVSSYSSLAKADTERYTRDMEIYNQKKEQTRYNTERLSCVRHTTFAQGNLMQYQQPGINAPPAGTHHFRRDYNTGYQTDVHVPHSLGPSPVTDPHNGYYRPEAPYGGNRNSYVNNMQEQHVNNMNAQNSSGNYSFHAYPTSIR